MAGPPIDTKTNPNRASNRLRLLALLFLLLGGAALATHHAPVPWSTTVAVSDLNVDDGLLVGDFARPWPFRLLKQALEHYAVKLPDGTELERYPTRHALQLAKSAEGFLVDEPEIAFRLDGAPAGAGPEHLSVTLPVRTSDIIHKMLFGIAAILLLLSARERARAVLRARGWRPFAGAAAATMTAFAGLLGLSVAQGVSVWLALWALLAAPLVAAALLLRADAARTGKPPRAAERLLQLALVLSTVLGSCALAEVYLAWQGPGEDRISGGAPVQEHWFQLPDNIVRLARSRGDFLTLPNSWQVRDETVEGATRAYTWHDALHVSDQSGFRRLNGPFPAKDPETLRILAVGDSLTYGEGIAEEWTYSRLLERALQEDYRVEVINLGIRGFQSEDVLDVLYLFLPQLDPDLVIYAVCLNDFLPSGKRVYTAYTFPFPKNWKEYLLERTALAQLLNDGYSKLLMALDLRRDFYDDILAGGETYQSRFARDVTAMNRIVRDAGLPPAIGIVFHQFPSGDPRAWDLIEIAERSLDDAGFDLISVMSWRERFKDRVFPVSRWEGHPNELAHSLIAEELYERLLRHSELQSYRKASASPTPGS